MLGKEYMNKKVALNLEKLTLAEVVSSESGISCQGSY